METQAIRKGLSNRDSRNGPSQVCDLKRIEDRESFHLNRFAKMSQARPVKGVWTAHSIERSINVLPLNAIPVETAV